MPGDSTFSFMCLGCIFSRFRTSLYRILYFACITNWRLDDSFLDIFWPQASPVEGQSLQNQGVCGQAFLSFPSPTPFLPPLCSRSRSRPSRGPNFVRFVRERLLRRLASINNLDTRGAFHSTKNSGLNFQNFRMSNGTVFSTRPDRSRSIPVWAHFPPRITRQNAEGSWQLRGCLKVP